MKNTYERDCGIALLVFILLLLVTLVLHPAGGKVAYLIRHSRAIIITHSIALFSIPFGWLGFRGLSRKLGTTSFYPMLGFAFLSVAMVAVLLAATANGLVLPLFLQQYADAASPAIDSVLPLLQYNFTINKAFDYIYTLACCMAILCWSVSILRSAKLPRWIGAAGVLLFLVVMAMLVSGLAVNHLQGFRISMIGIVAWTLIVAITLMHNNRSSQDPYPA